MAYNLSGFNPNTKENFGAGYMCGMLFVFDLPFAVLTIIWNFLLGNIFRIRSVGIIAFKEIYNPKSTLGGIIGFVLVSVGVGGWFNTGSILGPGSTFTYQQLWISIAILLAIINLTGAFYVAYKIKRATK